MLTSESDLQSIAAEALRDALPRFSECDMIRVESVLERIRLDYIAAWASRSPRDRTRVYLRLVPAQRLMWIGELRFASSFRSQGLGRRLRQAAEGVARRAGIETIQVLPLTAARSFWQQTGYRPHGRTTRVLAKHLNKSSKKG